MKTSIRAKALKSVIRFSKFLATPTTVENLAEKREGVRNLEKYFPLSQDIDIEKVKKDTFAGEFITLKNTSPQNILYYIHGGGFVFDNSKIYRDLIARLCKASDTLAFSLDYSASPEHPYPVALHEALAAYHWLLRTYKPSQITIMGDSAGGALTLSLLHSLRDSKLPMPACAVTIAPATDATLKSTKYNSPKDDFFVKPDTLEFFMNSYFGSTKRNDPIASPLHGSLKGFPPLLIHIDRDELVYGDAVAFQKKAKSQGVDVELYVAHGLWHVWHIYARYIPEARAAIAHIGEFICKNSKDK